MTLAGGLHPAIRTQYFRIGHMGEVKPGDILAALGAIESALRSTGYSSEPGKSLAAAMEGLI